MWVIEMSKDEFSNQQICVFLDMIYHQNKKIEEKIDCIMHTICKNNDEKTIESIRKYLLSDFRNNRGN
jgi:hypothetical protein